MPLSCMQIFLTSPLAEDIIMHPIPSSREAWHSLGSMPKLQAMELYLKKVSALVPDWETLKITPSEIQVVPLVWLNQSLSKPLILSP